MPPKSSKTKNYGGLNLVKLAADVRAVQHELALYKKEVSRREQELEEKLSQHKQKLEEELSPHKQKHEEEPSPHKQKHEEERLNQKKILKKHQEELSWNTNVLSYLTVSSKEYMQVRNRFISVFKRDKLHTMESSDYKIITNGNIAADNGDAFADAALYTSLNQRSDGDTFMTLYGLHPELVSSMSKYRVFKSIGILWLTCSEPTSPALKALNIHASIISSQTKVATERFYESFTHFIKLLKDYGYKQNLLKTEQSCDLVDAYMAFLQYAESEVSKVSKVKQD